MPEEKTESYDEKFIKQRKTAVIFFLVLFFIFGVLTVCLVRNSLTGNGEVTSTEEYRIKSYEKKIRELEEDIAKLSGEISDLNIAYDQEIDRLASSDNDFFRLVEFYNSSIDKYQLYAGVSTVNGQGIEISVDDANPSSNVVTQFMLVHDTTLLSIVNVLREAGAQAISINGERIVFDSELVCMGTSIKVNGKKLFAPFNIKAIGNSENLYNYFTTSSVYKNILIADLLVSVTKSDAVRIVGYNHLTSDSVSYLNNKE